MICILFYFRLFIDLFVFFLSNFLFYFFIHIFIIILFAFFTEVCVPPDFLCDNTNDCGNLYDEQNCEAYQPYMCTFEEGKECFWTQDTMQDDIGMSVCAVKIILTCT